MAWQEDGHHGPSRPGFFGAKPPQRTRPESVILWFWREVEKTDPARVSGPLAGDSRSFLVIWGRIRRGFRCSACRVCISAGSGIEIFSGHDPDHIQQDVEWVIRSAAVCADAPEIMRAIDMDIPVSTRGEVLPELLADHISIAVGGTHGKTTTTSLIASILGAGGLEPTVIIGGKLNSVNSNARLGASRYLVTEAD